MRVCVHEGEIHYSDNESIWDNMRQFTSPVVVSSIQGEDTSPARSQRMSSSAAASLACLSIRAAAMPGPIQEHRRKCLFRSSFLIWCCFRPLVRRRLGKRGASRLRGQSHNRKWFICFSFKCIFKETIKKEKYISDCLLGSV